MLSQEDVSWSLKGRVHVFFIRVLDIPPLGESNLMGPKKSVGALFCHSNSFHLHIRPANIFLHILHIFQGYLEFKVLFFIRAQFSSEAAELKQIGLSQFKVPKAPCIKSVFFGFMTSECHLICILPMFFGEKSKSFSRVATGLVVLSLSSPQPASYT